MAKAEGPGPDVPGEGPAEEFFAGLAAQAEQPLLRQRNGTIRFDLADGPVVEHWLVTIRDGRVSVSRRKGRADTVVHADREVFEAIVSGRMNGMAAFLRGQMMAEGDLGMVMIFQRLFPGPVGMPRPAPAARKSGRERVGVRS